MGRFEEEKAIINNRIKDYVNYARERGRYVEGNMTPVTYFSKNEKASSYDIGLGGVVELIGNESPIKYNKIENVPLMNFDESQLTYEYDEDEGLDTNIELTASIPSGVIKPKPDDLFYINVFDNLRLFRISNVEASNIDSNFFYKIDFFLIPDDINIIEERQLMEDVYQIDYDPSGPNKFMIIEKTNLKIIDEINEIMNLFRDNYIKDFYDKRLNIFKTKEYEYDKYLSYFIKNNELFIEKGTFYSNIYLDEELEFDNTYFKTIFYLLEKNKPCLFNQIYNSINKDIIVDKERNTVFSRTYNTHYSINWSISGNGLFANIFRDIQIKDESNWIVKLFLTYFKNDFITNTDKPITMLEIIKEEIEYFRFDIKAYILIPCFLYMFKQERNRLLEIK